MERNPEQMSSEEPKHRGAGRGAPEDEDRIAILQRLGKRPDDPTGATIEGWRLMVALGLRSDWP